MNKWIPYIGFICLLFAGCGENETILENEELVFIHSYPINIPVFEYADAEGNIRRINGEVSYEGSPDTLSSQPVFTWDNIGISIVSVGVFTEPIEVNNGEILNTSDIVWHWHSGMPTEREDTIQFFEGGSVILHNHGEIQYEPPLEELEENKDYYWAVWGWGKSGTRILYSSKELKFHVSN